MSSEEHHKTQLDQILKQVCFIYISLQYYIMDHLWENQILHFSLREILNFYVRKNGGGVWKDTHEIFLNTKFHLNCTIFLDAGL